jgi:ABC-type branched-subunit amino acid transport system ATPase component/branched-subunit amino acid ABC-type transport system permease component
MLPFIIAGLTTGSVYALAGVGLVLTYKTSGVFNFAHGATATVSAYVFYTLHVQHGVPWWVSGAISVFVLGPAGGLLMERLARPLATASLSIRVVATVAVLLIVQSLAVIIYGTAETRTVPKYLPASAFTIGSTVITLDQLIVFALGAIATAGLYVYLSMARTGIAMRAVVGDPDLLGLAGTNPVGVRRWAWMIGVTFASASGVLLVPFITLDATTLTFLVVAAFGAAAIGRFHSLPGTFLGGLAIGVAAAVATKYFTTGLWSGVPASLPFLILFLILLVSPRGRLVERAPVVPRAAPLWTAPWQVQALLGAAAVTVLALVPSFAGFHLADWSRMLALTVLFLSLGLLVRTSGQVSLCHASFMAVGACAYGHLMIDRGWPWPAAMLMAGVVAIPIGAVLAIPAIRLSGLYLALATFGFGVLLQYMFYAQPYMFGKLGLGVAVPAPQWRAIGLDDSARSFYYFCLVIVVAVTALVLAINRSRLGRLLRALADSPIGLATSGASVNVTRVLVFCISAFLAAIAGVLESGAIGQATSDSYPPLNSMLYFVLIVIGLGGAPWYALAGAIGTALLPSYITGETTNSWLAVLFGVFALVLATGLTKTGVHPSIASRVDRLVRRSTSLPHPAPLEGDRVAPEGAPRGIALLRVVGVRVTFGGLVAVDNASLEAPTGRITGLIGPNGAGKTTLFNACTGLNRPDRGRIYIDNHDVTGRGPAYRARHGLGRTFQQMELFDNLTVWENIAMGLEGSFAGPNILRHLVSSRRAARQIAARTDYAIGQCGLEGLSDRVVGSLSTGQRRLVELARCLVGSSPILLLDEPSSGLDRAETARFADILRRTVDNDGVGILLVEHDMALVTEVCDHLYVLDFGKLIFEGSVADTISSPVVQAAYLGDVTSGEAADVVLPVASEMRS